MSLLEYILGTLFGLALSFPIQYAVKYTRQYFRRKRFDRVLAKMYESAPNWKDEWDNNEDAEYDKA